MSRRWTDQTIDILLEGGWQFLAGDSEMNVAGRQLIELEGFCRSCNSSIGDGQ